ncbi:predicted protein [Naegleria gruberi]|uniref:Predicted protein n=1 Tax=Naegleria gruberi TaxID=5762 RepID=D2VAG3_NAEGR|nr:uncharacterized protein NAEGRDRAFT_32478 [Naegleria gruberi]EFC46064.1 predicted protein [Naegleria gruberi]|eukprot:XP_002678808.1 predicted protein [Naegleria gruberi strain NEG-M]
MREDDILSQLRLESEEQLGKASVMISTPEQTQLLKLLIKFSNVKSILEIGTLTGYSTLAFALCDKDINITTLDINEEWSNLGKKYWKLANVDSQIKSIIKPALQSLQELKQELKQFDLIYIDADKENQLKYIDFAYDLLRDNGLLIIDNVLWGGQVVFNEFKNTSCEFIRK